MEEDFKYREKNYFNSFSTYEFYDEALKSKWKSRVTLHDGTWYTVRQPSFKCTSIKCR